MKLSDEISIIPTKKGGEKKVSNGPQVKIFNFLIFPFQSEVIDLEDEEEIDDVEKEVIELGDTPKKDKEEGTKRAAEGGDDEPENKRAKSDESENKE